LNYKTFVLSIIFNLKAIKANFLVLNFKIVIRSFFYNVLLYSGFESH